MRCADLRGSPSSGTTSVLGAAPPRCAVLKKSSFWPYHTARSDSSVNILLESDTQSGGSSGLLRSLSRIFVSTFLRMHRKSRSHSITAASRKRGSSIRHTAAFFSACTVWTPADPCSISIPIRT
ncbi:hypothetical protein M9458_041071, partial [Cirrhinus mrigala]